ncbi:MAG: hypothetical protein ACP5NE_02540 [Candidatus Micrarchaeia archaeon]
MAQMVITRELKKGSSLSERERVVLAEIGKDEIISASSFVDYVSEQYAMPKSTAWYVLRKLKDKGMLDFASKEEVGKPLQLTRKGLRELACICTGASSAGFPASLRMQYARWSTYGATAQYEEAGQERENISSKMQYKQKAFYSLG